MNTKDTIVWTVFALLLGAAIAANYYFISVAVSLRAIAWIIFAGVMLVIAIQTSQGKSALAFAKEARLELLKVVWPTRKETMQTAMMVIAVVFLVAIILWFLDSILVHIIGWLTGQRG